MNNINFQEIFTVPNIIIYLVLINLLAFYLMWSDKKRAKKNEWRVQEKTFLILTALGAWIGNIAGMYVFRHKTKKNKFTIGIPAIIIIEIIVILYFVFM